VTYIDLAYISVSCYKVLVAVEQGETLVKALEEAVPEDVRGKLTASVTEILHSKRENFSLDALKPLGWNNVRPATTKTVAQEKLRDSDHKSGLKDAKMADQNRSSANAGDGGQKDIDITTGDSPGESIELSQGKPSQTSGSVGTARELGSEQTQSNTSDKSNSGINDSSEEQHRTEQGSETTPKKPSQTSGPVETATETGSEQVEPNTSDKSNSGTNDSSEEQHRTEQGSETPTKKASNDQSAANSNEAPKETGHPVDSTTDQNPQPHAIEKEGDTIRTSGDKAPHNMDDQSTQVSKPEQSKPSPVTMAQALDALTGFDDSTQMAVTSVFGVLENMIDQFQKQQDSENGENSDENDGDPSVDESGEHKIQSPQQPEDSSSGVNQSTMSKNDYAFAEKNPKLSIVSSGQGKMRYYQGNEAGDYADADGMKQVGGLPDYLLDIAVNSSLKAQYAMYLHEFLKTQLQLKSPEPSSATDLVLDPQEGKWKIADQMHNAHNDIFKSGRYNGAMEEVSYAGSTEEPSKVDNVVEPPYFISGKFPDLTYKSNTVAARSKPGDDLREALACFIRDELSSALKFEVGRKIGITDTRQLERGLTNDVEQVAAEVSKLIVFNCKLYSVAHMQRSPTTVKFGATYGKHVVQAVATAVQQSQHLRIILPVGVIIGVTLACLRNYFHVDVFKHDHYMKADVKSNILNEGLIVQDISRANIKDSGQENTYNDIENTCEDSQQEMTRTQGQGMMVGAVTAALGASALVAHHRVSKPIYPSSFSTIFSFCLVTACLHFLLLDTFSNFSNHV
jgi:hypothetical protein